MLKYLALVIPLAVLALAAGRACGCDCQSCRNGDHSMCLNGPAH